MIETWIEAARASGTRALLETLSRVSALDPSLTARLVTRPAAGWLRAWGCCLNYKIPGKQHCSTCPLIPEQERKRRLLAWIAQQARSAAAEG